MRVLLNGEPRELADGETVAGAVGASGAPESGQGVAVAIDGEVVRRAEWERTTLREGQRVEVVRAVQGGA